MVKKSLGSKLYSGTAAFGRIEALLGAIFATVLGLAAVIAGIYLIRHKTTLTKHVLGEVVQATCTPLGKDNTIKYYCDSLRVTYKIGDKSFTINSSLPERDSPIMKGDSITVYYNPSSPENGKLLSDNTHILGWALLVGGILIPAGSWLWYWLTRRYQVAAAVGGVSAGLDLLRR